MYKLEFDGNLKRKIGKGKHIPPKNIIKSIVKELEEIAKNVNTYHHKPLFGRLHGKYKHVFGQFRAIYTIEHETKRIIVQDINSRGKIYK